jgi:hypothetical protein
MGVSRGGTQNLFEHVLILDQRDALGIAGFKSSRLRGTGFAEPLQEPPRG